jgi:hypothetical protein
MGQLNYIGLAARERPIPIFTADTLLYYTGTIHTITASLPVSLLVIESLHYCLLES